MATTPTTTTTTPPSTPIILNIDYLNESWCDIQFKSSCSSTGSISHLNHTVNPEVLEKLLQEAQKEASFHSSTPPLPSNNDPLVNMFTEMLSSPSSISPSSCCQRIANVKALNVNSTSALAIASQGQQAGSASCSLKTLKLSDMVRLSEQDLDQDDDVDLEYTEEDDTTSLTNNLIETNHVNTLNEIESNKCSSSNGRMTDQCKHCLDHKKQIDLLMEKQLCSEKQMIKLRKEYEDKILMNKSLNLTSSSCSSSASITPPSLNPAGLNKQLVNNSNNNNTNVKSENSTTSENNSNNDWMKYWSSRPQINPPKEWNFVHPNSSKSKFNKLMINNDDISSHSKLISKESIGKLIFTHMASFILGATLMFLLVRKHLNIRSSIFFI